MSSAVSERLLGLVPDVPRWVETRGMLRTGRGHPIEDPERPDAFVMVGDDRPLVFDPDGAV